MARLHETKQCYSSLSKSSLQHPILFVIDMINGFVRRGALHDPAIAQAAQPIKDLEKYLWHGLRVDVLVDEFFQKFIAHYVFRVVFV